MGEFIEAEVYTQLARIGKALASPVRLRLLDLLEKGESDVEGLVTASGVGLKNTSAQLQQLRGANLVTTRREGNRVFYRLAGPEVSRLLGSLQSCAEIRLADLRLAIGNLLGNASELKPVTADELRAHIDDPRILIIDVRPSADYARGHVPGAISLPAAELRQKMDSIPRDVEVIAYCQGPYCVLSPDLVRLLRSHEIPARPLEGGITRWQREGGALQTEEGPSEERP
ncbi:ArsR/SmtB family transcription factor [Streptomyces olivaceus]|uniref:ArsR/SmtB family transcription factor n=1 Tax=Streptomyces olivaceus TaxID=47716 RepID=UPI001CCA1024|nr:metalloregulator ArsR/SmtB family transcription factor [Streptomyces olivaceus]MBZ6295931.1 metalloregulator ArsR/SmtB family transcription factor [Streptomyces olivaceus]MBZ6330909.1 metalloregulator ArsR/SmtB family transcription factor [Streptomyces olivaceus]